MTIEMISGEQEISQRLQIRKGNDVYLTVASRNPAQLTYHPINKPKPIICGVVAYCTKRR